MAMYTTLTEEEQKKQKTQEQTVKAPELNSNARQLTTTATETPAVQHTTQQKASTVYNPANDTAYQQAMSALNTAKQQMPIYQNSYEADLQNLYNQITGRDKFSYNVNEDALYQQYKDSYVNQGRLAMKDTMGQAAALTGGYGSSYGQSVGQQQYNAYLQNLNDVVPELYGMAYQRYQDQGDALKDQYAMMGQLADDEYGKYQDAMNQYWQNLSYLQSEADTLYNRGLQEAELAYAREQDAYAKQQDAYAKQQDAYGNLVDMITNLGYMPGADELETAGMSDAQYQAYLNYYKKMNPDPVVERGGGSSSGKRASVDNDENNGDIDADIAGMKQNGMSDHEIVGYLSEALRSGQISTSKANELEKKYTKGWI